MRIDKRYINSNKLHRQKACPLPPFLVHNDHLSPSVWQCVFLYVCLSSSFVLRWPCEVDRMLNSSYKLTLFLCLSAGLCLCLYLSVFVSLSLPPYCFSTKPTHKGKQNKRTTYLLAFSKLVMYHGWRFQQNSKEQERPTKLFHSFSTKTVRKKSRNQTACMLSCRHSQSCNKALLLPIYILSK